MIINDFIIKKVPLSDDLQFCYYRGGESVVIVPDGVTDIQSFVFGDMDSPNDTITKIVLPNSCRRIDEYAFANCTSLKELTTTVCSLGTICLQAVLHLKKYAFQKMLREL